jgi:DNA-binding LacI/PurR family transcriptional regulator
MVLISDNSEGSEEVAGARTFLAARAPGVILTPVGKEATKLLAGHGVAVVEVDRRLAEHVCDAVVIDNERGGREATGHLLAQGHRRIGLLVAGTDWTTDIGRLNGYLQAHERARVPVVEHLILRVEHGALDAEQRIADLLDEHAPTALFAANNLLAEQAWHVIRRRRQHLPEDISLVGFDDVPWMGMVEPGITVVSQPSIEMGRRAARLLLRRVEDPQCEPRVECLEPLLVIRGSTGPPRHG